MPNSNDYAIIVGIDYYQNIPELEGPEEDARKFQEWLLDPKGGDMPGKNIFLVPASNNPLKPLQDDIDERVLEIYNAAHQNQGRRFYFFFAGHGYGKTWQENGLCLPKWSKTLRNYALSSATYLEQMVNSGIFQEIYFFLDCCRSQLFNVQPMHPTFGWPQPPQVAQTFVAYAAEFDNVAYEAAGNGQQGAPVHGHFTRALIQGLKGAATDQNNNVTTESIKGFLKRKVEQFAQENNQSQTVKFEDGFTLPGIITGVPVVRVDVTINLTRPVNYTLEDPQLNVVRQGDQTSSPWKLQLPKGTYCLYDNTGQTSFFRIDGIVNPLTHDF